MRTTTEVTSILEKTDYAPLKDGDSHFEDTQRSSSTRDKIKSGFNYSDDTDGFSVTKLNSQPISTGHPSGAQNSRDAHTNRSTAADKAPLPVNVSHGPSEFVKFLIEGVKVGLSDDLNVPIDKVPEWFDPKKYKLGQQFGQKYYSGICFSSEISLALLFLPAGSLEPLIFTGKSHTPYEAFKRYLSTTLRMKTWFDCDIWNPASEGFQNMKTVRALHLNVSKKINNCTRSEIERFASMSGEPGKNGVWCPMYMGIKKDLESSGFIFSAYDQIDDPVLIKTAIEAENNKSHFCQTAMSLTTFGFMGLIVLYPEKLGAGSATEEELEGFVHLWRCIGYLLGVEEDFNLCRGTFSEVRQRLVYSRDIFFKPRLLWVTADWEHMVRCAIEGISYYSAGECFEVAFSYLCWILDVEVPSVSSKLTLYQRFALASTKLFMCHLSRIPIILSCGNYYLISILEKAHNAPKEWHRKLQNMKYDFQNNRN